MGGSPAAPPAWAPEGAAPGNWPGVSALPKPWPGSEAKPEPQTAPTRRAGAEDEATGPSFARLRQRDDENSAVGSRPLSNRAPRRSPGLHPPERAAPWSEDLKPAKGPAAPQPDATSWEEEPKPPKQWEEESKPPRAAPAKAPSDAELSVPDWLGYQGIVVGLYDEVCDRTFNTVVEAASHFAGWCESCNTFIGHHLCNVKKGICKSSDDGFANHRRLLTQLNYPSCSAECRFARTPRTASSSSSITGT